MPHSTHGTVVLMGSGEMAPSMVEVHRYAMSLIEGPVRAAFVDTPAGFQLNADLIAQKAVEYFRQSLNMPLKVASFKSARRATPEETQAAVHTLHEASYIFAGPGSPSYALRNWRHTPVLDAIFETLAQGGCLTFASAASLTLGRFTIPVYEIYKVGDDPCWLEGLDLLGHSGLDVCVVPHWNNTSGGDHDTRFCFMGEPRWRTLESQLPPSTAVLGIDEHTACILRLDQNIGEVRGVGQVTIRRSGEEEGVFVSGDSFSLDLLRSPVPAEAPASSPGAGETPAEERASPSWEEIRARYEALRSAQHPPHETVREYIYDLMALMSAARERQDWETMRRAEEALREALVGAMAEAETPPVDEKELIRPYVDLLLTVRGELRAAREWALADRIRDGLHELGIIVEDGPEGSTWRVGNG